MKKYGIPPIKVPGDPEKIDRSVQEIKSRVLDENVLKDIRVDSNEYARNTVQRQNAISLTYSSLKAPKIF